MTKILITGNGFDLYHRLPTLYSDFISTLKKIEGNDDILVNYSDYFQVYERFNHVQFDKDEIISLKNILNNKWFQCFKTEYAIDTWIDFETKLEEVLSMIWGFTYSINEKVFKFNDLPAYKLLEFSECYNTKIQNIENLVNFNLVRLYEQNHLKFHCVNDYTKINGESYTNLDDSKISKMLLNEWNGFIHIFDTYLKIFINPLINSLALGTKTNLEGIDYYFTFNYTDTFENIYLATNVDKVNFIHGKRSNVDKKNTIVLGFNDIENKNVNKKFYIPFTKYYQKFQKETDYKFLLDFVNIYGKFNDYTFYIWGHSLDISDIEYINEIFDIISKSRSCVKVFYHSESSKNQLLLNLTHILGRKKMTEYMKNDKIIFLELNENNIVNELCNSDTE